MLINIIIKFHSFCVIVWAHYYDFASFDQDNLWLENFFGFLASLFGELRFNFLYGYFFAIDLNLTVATNKFSFLNFHFFNILYFQYSFHFFCTLIAEFFAIQNLIVFLILRIKEFNFLKQYFKDYIGCLYFQNNSSSLQILSSQYSVNLNVFLLII